MSDGINPSELNEAPQRTDQVKEAAEVQPEIQEAAISLEKATLKPVEKVEAEGDFQRAEDLEKEVKASLDTVPDATATQPAEISLEAAGVEGTVTIGASEGAADGGQEDAAVAGTGEGGPGTEDQAVETAAPAESAVESPPSLETPDPVEPMFPASAHGTGVSESAIDVAKTPTEDHNPDELEISPVQDVGGAAVPVSGEDFSAEMEGAQQGELQGSTLEEDGNQAYELRTDGQTGIQEATEHINTMEDSGSDSNAVIDQAQQTLETPASEVDSPEEETADWNSQSPDLISTPQSTTVVETESTSVAQQDGSNAKTTGYVPSQGSGLPINDNGDGDNGDDDTGDDPVDDSGDGNSDTPPPPPDTGSDTGVSPSLPGTDPTSGGQDIGRERQVPGGTVSEITGRPETETEGQSPEYDPTSGIRGEEILEEDPQLDWGLPGQEEQNGAAEESTEYPPEPQLEDFQIGVDDVGDPIYDQESYNQAMAAWQSKTFSIAIDAGEKPPYSPESHFSSEAEQYEYYSNLWEKIVQARQTIGNEIENWPADGNHSFTVLKPQKISGPPPIYADRYLTISSLQDAQDALHNWNMDDLKYIQEQATKYY